MYNILVCDDDKDIVNAIEIYLKEEKYSVFKAYNGLDVIRILENETIDLIILDIMMPKLDGIETLKEIRNSKNIPVIILSAKSEDEDKIEGLNLGADDYITKPFNSKELIARVNAVIRRFVKSGEYKEKEYIYQTGELIIDDSSKTVFLAEKEIKFTPTEYNILKFLVQNKGKVYSIQEIYQKVWLENSYGAENNIIAVHIRHIREKIEINPREPRYLKVIWGVGYKMENIPI